jgi:putative nucleotidyltransferase with HDIG domain
MNPGPSTAVAQPISFSAIISALSFAIDLTEGAAPGHAVRTCILGMRIAQAIDLPHSQRVALYHALLLKDIGCSSNAALACEIVGGDERVFKTGAKLADWTRPFRPTLDTVKLLWRNVLPKASALTRLGRIGQIAWTQQQNNRQMMSLRCERGAKIAQRLGLSEETSAAICAIDEHWNGSGFPGHAKGEAIPLLARILSVAQHLDIFCSERSPEIAIQVLRARSGRWFDPRLVQVVCDLDRRGVLWNDCLVAVGSERARELVLEYEPVNSQGVAAAEVDRICEAFAEVVDAKSPFTYRHSLGVAEVATSLATVLKLPPERVHLVRRAALLHDLGKLAIPNTILDKSGELSGDEWQVVLQHPRLTREILARIEPFAELAIIAGAHHEKLDGTGYPDHLTGPQLSLEARIVAVADVYQALTELRSYRKGLSHHEAMKILYRLAANKLDPHCVAAMGLARDRWTTWSPSLSPSFAGRPRPSAE